MRAAHGKMLLKLLLALTFALFCRHGLAEAIKPRNEAANPKTGQTLAEHRGWIYTREEENAEWKKLIPGKCPQWFSNGKRFVYFLDVGYDGAAELWSADAAGEARLRLTRSDYWIDRTPVLSRDGKKLAYHYTTDGASGFFEEILVIDPIESQLDEKVDAKVVLRRKPSSRFESLKWVGKNRLQVIADGKTIGIDTSAEGEGQLL